MRNGFFLPRLVATRSFPICQPRKFSRCDRLTRLLRRPNFRFNQGSPKSGVDWRGKRLRVLRVNAKDPLNLLQVMLAKGAPAVDDLSSGQKLSLRRSGA